jgi:hypothetical protein
MSVISKLWRACLPPQRTFFLFHLVHLQIFAARALGMLSALAAIHQLLLPFVNNGPFCQFLHLSTFDTVQWEAP